MSFSAVIATSASPSRRARLLEIVRHIGQYDLLEELIVIWQSSEPPGPEFRLPKLRIFKCHARAVSLARNLGASKATGKWIWFLDDDTIPASPTYLETARFALEGSRNSRSLDFVTSNVSGEGAGQVCHRINVDIPINNKTIWGNFWEPGLIVARHVFLEVNYDIFLGPGCLHGSSEGSDLGMRMLRAGHIGTRIHDLDLDHPRIERSHDYRNKLFIYALGNGLVAMRYGGIRRLLLNVSKCTIKIWIALVMLQFSNAVDQFVRLCGLVVGPCLQPGPPLNLEPSWLSSEDILEEFDSLSSTPSAQSDQQ